MSGKEGNPGMTSPEVSVGPRSQAMEKRDSEGTRTNRKAGPGGRKLMKVSQLSKLTGVSTSAINYYVRMGLLPPPIKTHRNMAYYDASYVQMINYIKKLQHQKHLPLSRIKEIMEKKIRIWQGTEGEGKYLTEDVFSLPIGEEGEEKVSTRKRILEAAGRLFARLGYSGVTDEDIMEEAEVTGAEYYELFSGKEEVFLDFAEELARAFQKKVAEAISEERDMLQRLRKAIPVAFNLIVENREIYSMYLDESSHVDLSLEGRWRNFTSAIVDDIRRIISKGIREGSIRPVKPDIAAHAIMGQLVRLANYWIENPRAHRLEDIVGEAMDYVTRALSP